MTTRTISNAPASNNPDYPVSTNTGVVDDGTQRITIATDCTVVTDISKYGGTATTLGQKTMSASVPVALASDQGLLSATSMTSGPIGTELGLVVRSVSGDASFATAAKTAFNLISSSYANVLLNANRIVVLHIGNSLNQAIQISFDAGTTTHIYLDPFESISWDFGAANKALITHVFARYSSAAPKSRESGGR